MELAAIYGPSQFPDRFEDTIDVCPVWTLLLRGEHYCAVKAPEFEDEGVRLCVYIHMHA